MIFDQIFDQNPGGGGVNRHSNLRILIENVRILKYEQNGGIITKRGIIRVLATWFLKFSRIDFPLAQGCRKGGPNTKWFGKNGGLCVELRPFPFCTKGV